jgi:hypothetical protein
MEHQIDPKLSHLSESQTQILMARYYSNEPIQALLREYRIDCLPNQLYALFPPEVVDDQRCRHCDVPMARERQSRSSLTYRKSDSSCPQCGHRQGKFPCRCKRCAEEKRRNEQILRDTETDKIFTFCKATWPDSFHKPAAKELSLRTAVALLALARTCLFVEDETSYGYLPPYLALESLAEASTPFAPQGDLDYRLLGELLAQRLIAISELSSPHAFRFEHGELRAYYPSKVRWVMTSADPELLLAEISHLAEATEWPSHWSTDIKDLWLEIALAECMEYFRHSAEERGLPEAGEKSTEIMLKSFLQHFSVAQCYRIIWAGAQRAADFLVRKGCTRKHAANYMIGECQRWADRARAENWEFKPFKRNFNLPRSSISHVFFDVFLKIGEAGFDSVPETPARHRDTCPPSQQNPSLQSNSGT